MGFIQVIEFRAGDLSAFRALEDEYQERIATEMTARRSILCTDHDDPSRHLQIVLFDSYESAMENSDREVTTELAARMRSLADGEPNFTNLDVVEERTL
jgi:hypothetical protein